MGRTSKNSENSSNISSVSSTYPSRNILTTSEIKSILEKNDWLIRSASSYINKLINLLNSERCSIFLTEADGYLIHIASRDEQLIEYKKQFIIPGSVPPTGSALENSINQVVYDLKTLGESTGNPLITTNKEQCTCWVVPIILNDQQIVGTLALCIPKANVNKHITSLLKLCKHCIEQELLLSEEKSQAKMLLKEQLNIFNRHAQADLIISGEGLINLISDKACELLGVNREDIILKNITSIIPGWDDIPMLTSRHREINNIEVDIANVPNAGSFLFNAKVLRLSSGAVDEIVCSIRSLNQVLKEANLYIGNRAVFTFDDIPAVSALMKRIVKEAKLIAQNDMHVTILGERYIGKRHFAEAIHNYSKRSRKGFIRVDLSSMNEEEMAEALWGYTGQHKAYKKRPPVPGALEFGNGGTLYINEVGMLPLELQDRLLDSIQTHRVSRLGANNFIKTDVRLIVSNSYDLSEKIDKGEFRIDLFYALSGSSLRIPPLRERKQDIPALLNGFIDIKSKELGIKPPAIPKKILLILKRYEWPNNFKEMKELAEIIIMDKGKMFKSFKNEREFKRNHLFLEHQKEVESILSLEEVEKEHIIKAYHTFNGSISKTSRMLGVSRNTLYLKLKKYGIDSE